MPIQLYISPRVRIKEGTHNLLCDLTTKGTWFNEILTSGDGFGICDVHADSGVLDILDKNNKIVPLGSRLADESALTQELSQLIGSKIKNFLQTKGIIVTPTTTVRQIIELVMTIRGIRKTKFSGQEFVI